MLRSWTGTSLCSPLMTKQRRGALPPTDIKEHFSEMRLMLASYNRNACATQAEPFSECSLSRIEHPDSGITQKSYYKQTSQQNHEEGEIANDLISEGRVKESLGESEEETPKKKRTKREDTTNEVLDVQKWCQRRDCQS
eukprot:gene14548-biopygen3981